MIFRKSWETEEIPGGSVFKQDKINNPVNYKSVILTNRKAKEKLDSYIHANKDKTWNPNHSALFTDKFLSAINLWSLLTAIQI